MVQRYPVLLLLFAETVLGPRHFEYHLTGCFDNARLLMHHPCNQRSCRDLCVHFDLVLVLFLHGSRPLLEEFAIRFGLFVRNGKVGRVRRCGSTTSARMPLVMFSFQDPLCARGRRRSIGDIEHSKCL